MEKTITAISTPAGTGGVAVIRISGNDAVRIADTIYRGKDRLADVPTHTVHYGHIMDKQNNSIDEVLVTVMRAPRTFTREDVVEISTHGGMTAPRRVLARLIEAGAYPAQPGEFTKRAFLNGRIDLSQAEAVIDIINAKTDLAQKNAVSQLEGSLSKQIEAIRSELVGLAAHMQVAIDYPDEDLEDITVEDIQKTCLRCKEKADALAETGERGRILRDGISTAIVGKPNVGKSSLLNCLAMEERAIVTEIAGTTRDVIEEYVDIDGVALKLLDTAGIRETEDVVEKIGVQRSKQSLKEADFVIVMLDCSRPFEQEDREILELTAGAKRVILVNKADIGSYAFAEQVKNYAKDTSVIPVSAKTGEGVSVLREEIKTLYHLGGIGQNDSCLITNMRHKTALIHASEALSRAAEALVGGMPQDIASIDINIAIDHLGEITGATVSDDIVNNIFHHFCVGK